MSKLVTNVQVRKHALSTFVVNSFIHIHQKEKIARIELLLNTQTAVILQKKNLKKIDSFFHTAAIDKAIIDLLGIKNENVFNIAVCELGGFLPIKGKTLSQ
jgi:predicted GTPase